MKLSRNEFLPKT